MTTYWLRVSGQNLSAFILDTQNLSAARGGSLTLLDVIEQLPETLVGEGHPHLAAITTGASTGLWSFEAENDEAAQRLASAAKRRLAGQDVDETNEKDVFRCARHATFSVSVIPAEGAAASAARFIEARETSIAVERRHQMSSAALVYPKEVPASRPAGVSTERRYGEGLVCSIDMVRPAMTYSEALRRFDDQRPPISRSVWDRRGYGMERKQGFYLDQLDLASKELETHAERDKVDAAIARISTTINDGGRRPFALQLGSIAEGNERRDDCSLRPSLADKIAVLYMDGNRFSKIQDRRIESSTEPLEEQEAFDKGLRADRRRLLIEMLNGATGGWDGVPAAVGAPSDEECETRADLDGEAQAPAAAKIIRFETLLWGGDELMFVMPARLGVDAALAIAKQTESWSIPSLTHAMGLVFCHCDAPIGRIQALARELGDHCKSLAEPEGRRLTLLAPMVLESFDHIGGSLDAYHERRTPPDLRGEGCAAKRAAFFIMQPDELRLLRSAAQTLRGCSDRGSMTPLVARRRVRMIARGFHAIGPTDVGEPPSRERIAHDRALQKALAAIGEEPSITRARAAFGEARFRYPSETEQLEEVGIDFGEARFWMMLEEFWDYLLPLVPEHGEEDEK